MCTQDTAAYGAVSYYLPIVACKVNELSVVDTWYHTSDVDCVVACSEDTGIDLCRSCGLYKHIHNQHTLARVLSCRHTL